MWALPGILFVTGQANCGMIFSGSSRSENKQEKQEKEQEEKLCRMQWLH